MVKAAKFVSGQFLANRCCDKLLIPKMIMPCIEITIHGLIIINRVDNHLYGILVLHVTIANYVDMRSFN